MIKSSETRSKSEQKVDEPWFVGFKDISLQSTEQFDFKLNDPLIPIYKLPTFYIQVKSELWLSGVKSLSFYTSISDFSNEKKSVVIKLVSTTYKKY